MADRERFVHQALHGLEIVTDARGWLVLPAWPGLTLEEFAGDTGNSPEARLGALVAASQALGTLHQVQITWPGDPHDGVGHGDAMLRNVQYDPTTRQACWFDFDMMHLPRVAPVDRFADDLRALLYSATVVLDDLAISALCAAVRDGYRDATPWRQLRANLQRGPVHWSALHYAQARPGRDRQRQLEELIRQDTSLA